MRHIIIFLFKRQHERRDATRNRGEKLDTRPLTFTSRARGSARAMGFAVEEPLQPFMGLKERRRSSAGKLFLGGTTHPHRALGTVAFGTRGHLTPV